MDFNSDGEMEHPCDIFGLANAGNEDTKKRKREESSDEDVEVPEIPAELYVLAKELLQIGKSEDIDHQHTHIKVRELCEHFWHTWWDQ